MMALNIIAAVARNGVIGRDNMLPWPRIAADMEWFRRHTLDQPVIMGRRTWDSLGGKGLSDRFNIVVSRSLDRHQSANTVVCRTIKDARWVAVDVAKRSATGEAFVIGGAEIYRVFLPLAQTIYLTEVDAEPEGDARFPDFDRAEWREAILQEHPAAGGAPGCVMKMLERI